MPQNFYAMCTFLILFTLTKKEITRSGNRVHAENVLEYKRVEES
jgi:hypothetical protein